ncbi:hypothetical protein KY495_07010 [Massilia sp. PAMC28688]|uniref:hypothetical protein n=1 Tax=Massilia sp. PAMC28688 TaxID=2861283 RepID=UPI001C6254F1|nr:hypothetical protein [Massilia sp. PAMC28688]QYF94920.1 hypothetical protein KY495_07010 [Massilia sp. PAMC28688]
MPTVTLYISPYENHPGEYLVVVDGVGFYQSANKNVGARLRGDDPWFDDHILGMGGTGLERVSQQGTFTLSAIATSSQLNEDWGTDEIYALVEVEGLGTFRTNTIKARF